MVERLATTRRKERNPMRNFKSKPTNPSQSNWTRHLLNKSKPIRLRSEFGVNLADLIAATAASTTLLARKKRDSQMLQERLDDARQQDDAHENCCRHLTAGNSARMSIIINQNDDHEPETTATSGENYQDSGRHCLLATSDIPRRRGLRQNYQLDKHHLHYRHHHHHHHQHHRHQNLLHHCQTISSEDEQSQDTMRSVKKLTRRNKSVRDRRPTAKRVGQQQPALMMAAICLAVVVSCTLIGLCDCDSESGALPPVKRSHLIPSHHNQRRTTRHTDTRGSGANTVAPSRRVDLPATQTKTRDQARKQELLSSMAQNIERQHWGLSSTPVVKVHSATSAENDDFLTQIIASHEAKGRPPVKTGVKSPPPTTSKAELDLSRIMMMHDGASAATSMTSNKQQLVSGQLQEAHKVSPPIKTMRWLTTSDQSPLKLLRKPTSGGGNLLTGVISSLLPSAASSGQQGDKVANVTSTNPFTPRANAKNYLMGPILGLGQMLMQTSSSPFYQSEASITDQSVYTKPANSFLSFASPKKSPLGGSSTSAQKAKMLLASPTSANNGDLSTNESAPEGALASIASPETSNGKRQPLQLTTGGWIKNSANQLAQSYFQDSFRDLLTLSQLPILSGGPVSTAPSDLEPGGKKWLAEKAHAQQNKNNRTQMIEDLLRYAYILGNVGVRRKRDPLKVLGSSPPSNTALALASHNTHAARPANRWPLRALGALNAFGGGDGGGGGNRFPSRKLSSMLLSGPNKSDIGGGGGIKPRGVMWDMATDPTLAVTVFHLLERASVALPLGFLLMPFVHMIRNPFPGAGGGVINLGRILPARASHKSVDYEELVKRIDMMDKILSRAMRPTHREASFMG